MSLRVHRADRASLLTEEIFTEWYNSPDSRHIAIIGEMGCRKTMAMSFLTDELFRRSQLYLPQPKVCYYYCYDGNSGEAVLVIRSLILQILQYLPGLIRRFFEWYTAETQSGHSDPAADASRLEDFLEEVLTSIDRQVFILIDGLDECSTASRAIVLRILKGLEKKCPRIKVIVSSRPDQDVLAQVAGMLRLNLLPDLQSDTTIARYLVETSMPYLEPEVKALIVDHLSPLVRGSALWLKMVVELLRKSQIRAYQPMRTFPQTHFLTKDLIEIYDRSLSRYAMHDYENLHLARTALALLAVARGL